MNVKAFSGSAAGVERDIDDWTLNGSVNVLDLQVTSAQVAYNGSYSQSPEFLVVITYEVQDG